jgi:hypothetical protein
MFVMFRSNAKRNPSARSFEALLTYTCLLRIRILLEALEQLLSLVCWTRNYYPASASKALLSFDSRINACDGVVGIEGIESRLVLVVTFLALVALEVYDLAVVAREGKFL